MILFPIKKGTVSQKFGVNPQFYQKNFGIKAHNGIDCVSFHNDQLLACADMLIYKVNIGDYGSVSKGFGLHGIDRPDDFGNCNEWLYWHTRNTIPVKEGQEVKQGDIVAYEGASGDVYVNNIPVPDSEKGKPPYKGTHLHWGRRPLKRVKGTDYTGKPKLNTNQGKVFVDSEGFSYDIMEANNGYGGFTDPFLLPIIYYPEWLVKRTTDIVSDGITLVENEIESVEIKRTFYRTFIEILKGLLDIIRTY